MANGISDKNLTPAVEINGVVSRGGLINCWIIVIYIINEFQSTDCQQTARIKESQAIFTIWKVTEKQKEINKIYTMNVMPATVALHVNNVCRSVIFNIRYLVHTSVDMTEWRWTQRMSLSNPFPQRCSPYTQPSRCAAGQHQQPATDECHRRTDRVRTRVLSISGPSPRHGSRTKDSDCRRTCRWTWQSLQPADCRRQRRRKWYLCAYVLGRLYTNKRSELQWTVAHLQLALFDDEWATDGSSCSCWCGI